MHQRVNRSLLSSIFFVLLLQTGLITCNPTARALVTSSSSDSDQDAAVVSDASDLGSNDICGSLACRLAAENIYNAINASADPCDNFYDYACGNWIAKHPLGPTDAEVSYFRMIMDKAQNTLQGLLGRMKKNMFPSEEKAKKFYQQCKNQDEIERLGAKPLLALLDDVMGGWPVLNPNWDASKFNPFDAILKIRDYGEESLFVIKIDQDSSSPTDNLITITEPDMYYTKDVLLSEAGTLYTESFMTLCFNVTSLMMQETGDKRDVSEVASDLTDQFNIGRYITLASETALEKRDLMYLKNITTLGANQQATFNRSSLLRNMTALLKAIFKPVGLADKINADTRMVLRYSPYFDRIDEKLRELEDLGDDGKRRLANYLAWRLIAGNIPSISKPYRDAYDDHLQRIQGKKAKKPKTTAELCATSVVAQFPLAVGAVYVRDYLPKDLKAKASMMIEDIKLGFKELLTAAAWMDNATYSYAVTKLDAMMEVVGYSDILVNNISLIDAEYHNISIGPTYFDTLQQIYKQLMASNLRRLAMKNQRNDPIADPIDITAIEPLNIIAKNIVIVTAATLQRPFFEAGNPQYLNYGGIGFVLGHEVTHSFDDHGSLYDAVGNMRTWWSNSTSEAYNTRKQTFVDEYNVYELPAGHVNGLLTLSENIADNGGLKAAYRGYFNHFRKRLPSPEPLLPGFLNATAEQLFFLAAGQMWCYKRTPPTERLYLLLDEHSPYEFRVIGPMSNMPEFAEAFNCSVGSRMNPTIRHAVW